MDKFTNDSIMLSALSAGSDRAFDALFVRYYPKVLRFVANFCGNREEAENIAQELFMDLWIRRERLAAVESLDNYLFISARNAALRYIRQSLRFCGNEGLAEAASDYTGGDSKMCYNELYDRVMREIATMPEQRRRVFLMSREDGKPNAEIAAELGISKRTVETHISLALTQMRKLFPAILVLTLIN